MISDATSNIVAFAIGWLCHAILLRLGKPVRRQWRRRPANSRPAQLRRPTLPTVSPWVALARAAATTETGEVQGVAGQLAAASEVCEAAGRAAVEVSADRAGWWEAMSKQQMLAPVFREAFHHDRC
jgi:hypothetical protein